MEPAAQPHAATMVPGTTGICLSGGGIRAAAFGLGALQALSTRGLVVGDGHADYLAAVSGGSYIAGALTLVAKGPITQDDFPTGPDAPQVVAPPDPFDRGSPEEAWVRNHLRYLVHGPASLMSAVGRLLGGILINLLVISLVINTVARPLGWLYGWQIKQLRSGYGHHVHVQVRSLTLGFVVALAGVGLLCGLWAILRRFGADESRHDFALVATGFFVASAVTALLFVLLPLALVAIRNWHILGNATSVKGLSAQRSTDRVGYATLFATIGSIVTGVLALIGRDGAAGSSATGRWLVRVLRPYSRRLRTFLLNLLATVFGPALLIGVFLLSSNWGAAHTIAVPAQRGHELWWWFAPLVLLILMSWQGDLVAWSLHPMYKRRLASAFTLRRLRRKDGTEYAQARPYTRLCPLSASQPDNTPELLVCAAVNISDYGRTPTGSDVGGFVFSSRQVGGPLVDCIPTDEYETKAKGRARDFTLPAAISITGAAISPSMGRMTRRPLRFLFALLNLRLGVWLPNPGIVKRMPGADDPEPTPRRFQALANPMVRLPLVGEVRRPGVPKPSLRYLGRELFGLNKASHEFVYVSDGGHYENLGLVELLRRGCQTIWCVDAAGDAIDTFSTIGTAISVARSELAIDIELSPEVMGPPPDAKGDDAMFVRATHAVGRIHYHDGSAGTLVHIKLGVPRDAPTDVLTFHRNHPRFPCDPTLNQLYTAERFDAYRTLGEFSAMRAIEESLDADGAPVAPPPVATSANGDGGGAPYPLPLATKNVSE
ncbi:MAG: patatin-like phospholipase family protein [Actinobacteria bacterium]|nr:patatin-like phospholipase family protein [Actinomycetota bacterium]